MAIEFTLEQSVREHAAEQRTIWCASHRRCDYVVMQGDDEVHFTDFARPGRLQLLRAANAIESGEALLQFAMADFAARFGSETDIDEIAN